jgi:hypothetical protein
MKRVRGSSPGLTLVELVVTLVIGVIFFLMVGAIIIYSHQSWLRSKQISDALDDHQYASRRINYLARQATTDSLPTTGAKVEGQASWKFAVYDWTSKATKYNEIAKSGTNMVRRYGTTDPPPATNPELLMRNVSAMQVDYDPGHSWVVISVTQTIPSGNLDKSVTVRPRKIVIHRNKTFKD